MTNQLIKTCQDLNECEGMGNSPSMLCDISGDTVVMPRKSVAHLQGGNGNVYGNMTERGFLNEVYGPYLKIDDQSEWSSAKFLARAGWDASRESIHTWLSGKWYSVWNKSMPDKNLDVLNIISKALKEANHELAYMQAIILLYKIDRESYNLGIEPLLEGKGCMKI